MLGIWQDSRGNAIASVAHLAWLRLNGIEWPTLLTSYPQSIENHNSSSDYWSLEEIGPNLSDRMTRLPHIYTGIMLQGNHDGRSCNNSVIIQVVCLIRWNLRWNVCHKMIIATGYTWGKSPDPHSALIDYAALIWCLFLGWIRFTNLLSWPYFDPCKSGSVVCLKY